MKRRISSLLIIVVLACLTIGAGAMTAYAKKTTVYDDVLKKGSDVYCAVGGETAALYKVDLKTNKVKKMVSFTGGEGCGLCGMTLRKGYIYYTILSDLNVYLCRIKTNGKSKKTLAHWNSAAYEKNWLYEISGSWIYYNAATKGGTKTKSKKVRLNGKNRKSIKKHKIKTKNKKTNASGYNLIYVRANRFYDEEMEDYDYAYNCYLKTPNRKIFLYKDYHYYLLVD